MTEEGHVSFTTDEHGEKWCEDCDAYVHELVEHVGSHQNSDFFAGRDERGVLHAMPKRP